MSLCKGVPGSRAGTAAVRAPSASCGPRVSTAGAALRRHRCGGCLYTTGFEHPGPSGETTKRGWDFKALGGAGGCVCTRGGGAWPSPPALPGAAGPLAKLPSGRECRGVRARTPSTEARGGRNPGTGARPLHRGVRSRARKYFSEKGCNVLQKHFSSVSFTPLGAQLLCTVKSFRGEIQPNW